MEGVVTISTNVIDEIIEEIVNNALDGDTSVNDFPAIIDEDFTLLPIISMNGNVTYKLVAKDYRVNDVNYVIDDDYGIVTDIEVNPTSYITTIYGWAYIKEILIVNGYYEEYKDEIENIDKALSQYWNEKTLSAFAAMFA